MDNEKVLHALRTTLAHRITRAITYGAAVHPDLYAQAVMQALAMALVSVDAVDAGRRVDDAEGIARANRILDLVSSFRREAPAGGPR